jgi:hypothetical protein
LGQYDSTLTPAALTRALILSAVISWPSSWRISEAYVQANWETSWGESLLTSTLDILMVKNNIIYQIKNRNKLRQSNHFQSSTQLLPLAFPSSFFLFPTSKSLRSSLIH